MSFKYSFTFPIEGPNKLSRFKSWLEKNAPGVAVSLPPQVPSKSTSLTVRVCSVADRDILLRNLDGASL